MLYSSIWRHSNLARLGLKVCVKEVRFAPVRAADDPGKPPENTRRASVKRTRLDCDQFKSADGDITKSPQICENKGLISLRQSKAKQSDNLRKVKAKQSKAKQSEAK